MPRIADTAINEAAPCKPEPPRGPYVSDYQPVYPPIPKQCPRCQGCIVHDLAYYDVPATVRCLCCGWQRMPIPLPQEPTMHKSGANLPSIIEVRR